MEGHSQNVFKVSNRSFKSSSSLWLRRSSRKVRGVAMATSLSLISSGCSSTSTFQGFTSYRWKSPPPLPPPRVRRRRFRIVLSRQPSARLLGKPSSRVNQASVARVLFSYISSGRLDEALSLFQSLRSPDAFLWNLMIRGFTNAHLHEKAVDFYYRMLFAGARPDSFTFPFAIKSFSSLACYDEGMKLHGRLVKTGLDADLYICNSLIVMYSKLGLIDDAERVFDKMHQRDSVSWNSMIGGYASNEEGWNALLCFKQMQEACGLEYDWFGIVSALAACCLELTLKKGKEIHCYVLRSGLDLDNKLQTALLDMYCKCGDMISAERLFDAMTEKNLVTWNALIGGYALNNRSRQAFTSLDKLQARNVPDEVTMLNLLPACAHVGNVRYGKAVHAFVIRKGFFPHFILGSALTDMYAKCGDLASAELLFYQIKEKSLVLWNTIIAAYAQNGRSEEAILLFIKLQNGHLKPDAFTILNALPAYAELASLRHGRQMHSYLLKSGCARNIFVLNSLIYMYAKCGDLNSSRQVFDRMVLKDIVSWNTLIMAYAIHGQGKTAISQFSSMKEEGLQPNKSTFVSLLTGCSKSGLANEGWMLFYSMQKDYNFNPEIEHYGCMVELLGRAGDLDVAVDFVRRMPIVPTGRIWGSLLTASRNNNNLEMAEFSAAHIFQLEQDHTGCYVLLSSMYADAGRWDDFQKVRSLMVEEGLKRRVARSIVELNGKTSIFINGEKNHPDSKTVQEVSYILSKKVGKSPDVSCSAFNQTDLLPEEKNLANRHSIRLAMSYALISSEIGSPILVKKNVRICNQCHQAIKQVSEFSKREIIAGDTKIFHHFVNGICCCGDYW